MWLGTLGMYRFAPLRTLSLHASHVHPCTNERTKSMRSLVSTDERRCGPRTLGNTEPAFMGQQRAEAPMHTRIPGANLAKNYRLGGKGSSNKLKQNRKRGEGRGGGVETRDVERGRPRQPWSGGLVQGVRVLTSAIAARVESRRRSTGGGSAKERQPGRFRPLPSVSSSTAAPRTEL